MTVFQNVKMRFNNCRGNLLISGQSHEWREAVNEELTPSNQSKPPQILSVWEEGHKDEAVQVQALNQDPVVICGQEVHEQGHHHFTANLGSKNSLV